MIEICTVGGFSEVGKNMTAIKYKDDAVILDMGLQVDKYIDAKDENDDGRLDFKELLEQDAIPDEAPIKSWRRKVRAIIPTHAHLDHLGAIPYMAKKYDADILCTPFSAEVLEAILKDNDMTLPNRILRLNQKSRYKLTEDISIEFIPATHSTPHTVMVAIHTPEGTVLYANDFKFDNSPVVGAKPGFDRLQQLGDSGSIRLLIMDSLYSHLARKTPSESIARDMLKDVMLGVPNKGKAIIVTTFSSHIARLKSIVDFSKKLKRQVVFLGRSLAKYVYAAENCGIIKFSDDVKICGYGSQVRKMLAKIEKTGREKYVVVATGHQGEPDAVLSRIVNKRLRFRLLPEDHVIFSCTTIPNPVNIANRDILERQLRQMHVRIFKDIHQSGHASREDHRDMINLTRPQHIIPAHGGIDKTSHLVGLAKEHGYILGKTVHLMQDGYMLEI